MGGIHFSCLLWFLTHVLFGAWWPSYAHAAGNMISLSARDGSTNYNSRKTFSLSQYPRGVTVFLYKPLKAGFATVRMEYEVQGPAKEWL